MTHENWSGPGAGRTWADFRDGHLTERQRQFGLSILVLALLIRLALAKLNIVYHPDEVWQYLEPAYGMVTGRWITTWEFREGIRSWIIPEILAAPMYLGQVLAPDSQWHLLLPRAFLSCVSMAIPASFLVLGKRVSPVHGLVALFVGAFWPEIFYFAPRSLSDAIACAVMFPAILCVYRMKEVPGLRPGILAGMLTALCFIIRFQLAPALLVLSVWGLWRSPRMTLVHFACGIALGLSVSGLADMAAGATPFVWILRNLSSNLADGRASLFGTRPAYWYLFQTLLTWNVGTLLLVPGIAIGTRRFPVIFWMALTLVVTHSLIPHKEMRFILFSRFAFLFLASVGTTDLAKALADRLAEPMARMTAGLLCIWLFMAAAVAFSEPFKRNWDSHHGLFSMQVAAGQRPDICGLGISGFGAPAPSYAFINRSIPVYMIRDDRDLRGLSKAINTIIARPELASGIPRTFQQTTCSAGNGYFTSLKACIYARPGQCHADGRIRDYNASLVLLNQ